MNVPVRQWPHLRLLAAILLASVGCGRSAGPTPDDMNSGGMPPAYARDKILDPKLAEAARAFTAWLQQVGGTAAGKYSLGLFTPANPNEKERILPLDTSIMDTFQPIAADDIALLKVGEIDKP